MHPQPSRAGPTGPLALWPSGPLALNGNGPRLQRRRHPAEIVTVLIHFPAVRVSRYTAQLSI
jgi:hypothetical protein